MKKLIAGILSTFLMLAGLVALSGTQATAAPGDPYPGSTPTEVESKPLPPNRAGKPRIRVNIDTIEGAGRARGRIYVTFVRRDGRFTYSIRRNYNGNPRTYVIPAVRKPGNYVVTVTYVPAPGSIYQPSTDVFQTRVTGKRR